MPLIRGPSTRPALAKGNRRQTSGTADRYAHGVMAMPGMAARHLFIQIAARASRA
jgi:hypothetical protein